MSKEVNAIFNIKEDYMNSYNNSLKLFLGINNSIIFKHFTFFFTMFNLFLFFYCIFYFFKDTNIIIFVVFGALLTVLLSVFIAKNTSNFIKELLMLIFFSRKQVIKNFSKYYVFLHDIDFNKEYCSDLLLELKYYYEYNKFIKHCSNKSLMKQFISLDYEIKRYLSEIDTIAVSDYIKD